MSASATSDASLQALLAHLLKLDDAAQLAVARQLAPDQLRSLVSYLGHPVSPQAQTGFASALTQVAVGNHIFESDEAEHLAQLDLGRMPIGLVATALCGLPTTDVSVLLQPLPAHLATALRGLLAGLPDGALIRSAASVRALLREPGWPKVPPLPPLRMSAAAPAGITAVLAQTPVLQRMISWLRTS